MAGSSSGLDHLPKLVRRRPSEVFLIAIVETDNGRARLAVTFKDNAVVLCGLDDGGQIDLGFSQGHRLHVICSVV